MPIIRPCSLRHAALALLAVRLLASPAYGEEMPGMTMPTEHDGRESKPTKAQPPTTPPSGKSDMPGMAHGKTQAGAMAEMPGMTMTGAFGSYPMTRDASGTSWQPDLAEHHGIHATLDDWMLMGHAMLWGIYDTQSGPRGDDKFFLAGMLMGMARRDLSPSDTLIFRAMVSPDPFMGRRGYPLLLATGETADGVTPLVDRQHPHDFLMELSGTYVRKLAPDESVFVYAGYPGEPALGPPAFMHRASAMDIPIAPITHHWLDSTHIAFGVVTVGFVQDDWKIEVSQFNGREPDQSRFDFDGARFDSTAVRASVNPDAHWSLQASWGFLKSPEQLAPAVDENRFTASASYVTRFGGDSSLSATLAWGLKDLSDGHRLNGALLEAEYKPAEAWTAFARAEWEENNEIDASGTVHGVGELTLGGIHDWKIAEHAKLGLGASYTFDFVPSSVVPRYGADPHGTTVFVRLALE